MAFFLSFGGGGGFKFVNFGLLNAFPNESRKHCEIFFSFSLCKNIRTPSQPEQPESIAFAPVPLKLTHDTFGSTLFVLVPSTSHRIYSVKLKPRPKILKIRTTTKKIYHITPILKLGADNNEMTGVSLLCSTHRLPFGSQIASRKLKTKENCSYRQ